MPVQPLPDFALEVYFSRWEFEAEIHLCASDVETLSVGELLDLAGDPAGEGLRAVRLGYIETWGTDRLRAAVAAGYAGLEPSDVLAFCGAQEALFWLHQLLLSPGDHAIVTVPNYQSIEAVSVAMGVAVDGLPLWAGEGDSLEWVLDLDRLAALIRPETRLLSVNFPNNPTGFVPPRNDWLALLRLCEQRGVRVISDEVYRGLAADPADELPQAVDVSPSAISVNVLSKAYGLSGLRLGWVATRDRALLARLERAKHYTSICNPGPSEHLGSLALEHREALLGRNRRLVAANRARLSSFMADHADVFDPRPGLGGCVVFPRLRGDRDVDAFCQELVTETGVLLLPGSVYRSGLATVPPRHLRFGLGRRDCAVGLARLAAFLESR
jgi:aspartate/methionine/tyrosine aminotransferase